MLLTGVAALMATILIVPVLKLVAKKVNLVDHPDKRRKLQKNAIPLVGGVAVFLVSTAIIVFLAIYRGDELIAHAADQMELVGLLIAASFLMLVGIIDDFYGLRGRQKLFGQIIAASILIGFGYSFESVGFYGFEISFGHFALLIMYVWILGCINSVNLLDGADGFATSLGIMITGGLCVISYIYGRPFDALICAAMCGALIGFLRFNFPPATAYLGDAGSMLIGLVVAAIAIRSATKQPMAYALFAPVALLAIPIIDTAAAIIRRQLTGKSIYSTDRGHLHHTLIRKGLSPRLALLWFVILCSTTVIGATFSAVYRQAEYAFISIIAVLCCLIGFKYFGVLEFKLVSNKAMGVGKKFLTLGKSGPTNKERQVKVRLQGNRNWESVWAGISEFAKKFDLVEIVLDLDLPWIHESFHANYYVPIETEHPIEWRSEIPLQLEDRIIGRVLVTGDAHVSPANEVLPRLIEMLADLEPYILATVNLQAYPPPANVAGKSTTAVALGNEVPELESSAGITGNGETRANSLDVRV